MTWAVYNATAALLVAAAWLSGLTALIDDGTGLVWAIAGMALCGALCARYARSWLDWLCEHGVTLLMGLLGTVIGFMTAISGATSGDEALQMAGVETALSTTAVGLVAHLYLILMERVTR